MSEKANFICPKCGSDNIDFMVSLFISAPINKYWGNLPKRAFRSKDIEIWGVDWAGRTIVCNNCRVVISDGVHRTILTNPQDNVLFSESLRSCPACDGRGYLQSKEETDK